MLRVRRIILSLAVFLGGGSICASIAYAWYLHSPWRHETIVADLGGVLRMPVEIKALTADGRRRGGFEGLSIRGALDAPAWGRCRHGRWQHADATATLTLEDVDVILAERGWSPAHMSTIAAALARCRARWPDVQRVDVRNLTVTLIGDTAEARAGALDGTATVTAEHVKVVGTARVWNGRPLDHGIDISARFAGPDGVGVTMDFPELPVSALPIALHDGPRPTTGLFSGRVAFDDGCWRINGVLRALAVSEWYAGVHGRVERLDIDATLDAADALSALQLSGRVDDIGLTPLWWALDQPDAGGCGQLTIDRAAWRSSRVEVLEVTGAAHDIDVALVAAAWGLPEVTGRLSIVIDGWHMDPEGVRGADFTVRVDPPAAERPLIDRSWLVALAEWLPHLEVDHLPAGLLEYQELSLRLVWDGDRLMLHGGAEDGRTALTLRMLGRSVPAVRLPSDGADVSQAWSDITAVVEKIIHMDVVGDEVRGYAHVAY